MVSFPPCKINLGLHVVAKRPDGFHDIETCFYPVPWTDILEVVPAKQFLFTTSGDRVPGPSADNLCVRAWELMEKNFQTGPVAMHLHKLLPLGAGLGGGSSNAAYVLKSLNTIFDLGIDGQQLKELAGRLGSDCAFFIEDLPQIGTGKGDVLAPAALSLKGSYLVIVKPAPHISTAEAYAGVKPARPARSIREVVENHPVEQWRGLLKNDFESDLFRKFPIVETLQQRLYAHGASYAQMSGSGSAVFGIFNKEIDLSTEFESFTYWSGYLR